MAAKKRKRTTSTRKKAVKRRATATRKTARKTAKKTAVKRKARKAAPRRTAKKIVKKARKTAPRGEFGEGNYKASRRFRKEQEDFVKSHRRSIPAMGKEAEAALEGPEGKELRAAEAEAANHAAGQD